MCICFTPIVVVQSLSHAQPTPWTATLIPYNHLILCRPLLLLPSVFPSIRVFSHESALHIRWSKYWSFSFSPSMNIQDWFPLGFTDLISLLSKGLSRVFSNTTVRKQQFMLLGLLNGPTHLYVTTGKTIAVTIWTLAGKLMSLLFKTLSRFDIVILPRRKCLLISLLQSPPQWFWSLSFILKTCFKIWILGFSPQINNWHFTEWHQFGIVFVLKNT